MTDPIHFSPLTRRTLLAGGGGLIAASLLSPARSLAAAPGTPIYAFAGCYNTVDGPGPLTPPRGPGIGTFRLDPTSGRLTLTNVFKDVRNPSWVTVNRRNNCLYAALELTRGQVAALRIDPASGALSLLNVVSSEGEIPAHVSTDPSGRWAFITNYKSGDFVVRRIMEDGSLGDVTAHFHPEGSPGLASPPENVKIGNFISKDFGGNPHAHMMQLDIAGRYAIGCNLGFDKVYTWRFDNRNGTLSPNPPMQTALESGIGPRHFVQHPNGRFIYVVTEEGADVRVFAYDQTSGAMRFLQRVFSLPDDYRGTAKGGEIVMTHNGRYVYTTTRNADVVTWYAVGSDGLLTRSGSVPVTGEVPRNIAIDPTGNFLFSTNQGTDNIVGFRLSNTDGTPATMSYTAFGTPTVLAF